MAKGEENEQAASPPQAPEQVAAALEAYLAEYPAAVVMEGGKVLFDMREAKYSLSAEHGRCMLHLWGAERNLVRRVAGATARGATFRLSTFRFGQSKPTTLELAGDKDRRTPSTRETTRVRYVKALERALERRFDGWRVEGFRTAMDLEKSFGPAYARGLLVQGAKCWAVIGVNEEETQTTVDGVLTLGILWLESCRAAGDGRRVVAGLKVVVPVGCGALTLSRMAWLNERRGGWELWEFDQREATLELRDVADQGNVETQLRHAPNAAMARERFAASAASVLALVPEGRREAVDQRIRSGTEMGFLLHGLEFARVRTRAAAESFNRVEEVTFGAGAHETALTPENEGELREYVARLFERRGVSGDKRDPLYRMQPERWLEGELRRDLTVIDSRLDARHVYAQVPAFAAGDRGMMDLLSVTEDGRLAVLELKAEEDLHLALQGLDYWVRVRWHHLQNPDAATGLGEFQRYGYFGDVRLAEAAPRLFMVAPALRIHPAVEVVLGYLSPRVEWVLVAVDERWRAKVKVVWRKRSG